MKVNITGRGVIPGIGAIPPVYKREMSEKAVLRLLNFPSFKVYDSSSGVLITKNNIKTIGTTPTTTTEKLEKVEENKNVVVSPKVEKDMSPPTNFVDDSHDVSGLITDEPMFENITPVVEEEPVVETEPIVDEAVEVPEDEVVEEFVDETEKEETEKTNNNGSQNHNKHNNNKNKNRNKNRH